MKDHNASLHIIAGTFRRLQGISALVALLLLGLTVTAAAAIDVLPDHDGQPEISPGPISTNYDDQYLPRAAYSSGVNEYLVVWEDVYQVLDHDIYAVRVNDQGIPMYGEIGVGVGTSMDTNPDIAYNSMNHEYLVVWENKASDTDHDIFAQRVNEDGTLLGSEIHVTYSTDFDSKPMVAFDPYTFGYLVAFQRLINPGEFEHWDVLSVLLDPAGIPYPGLITITNTPFDDQNASVACDGVNYLVTWESEAPIETNVYGQRVGSDGSLIGGLISISTWDGYQRSPRLAYNSYDAQYLVVWEDHHFSPSEIYGYRIDTDGNLVGSQIGVAMGGSQNHTVPDVAYMPSARSYLVVWQYEYSTTDHDIYSRRIAYDGSHPEAEVGISTGGAEELHPALASNFIEQGLVVWEDSRNLSTTGIDIYGSVETVYVPVISGVVYEGDVGDTSTPLSGVLVELGCSNDQGYFGTTIALYYTDYYGQFFLPGYILCEYYNIVEIDPSGFYSVGSQTVGGVVYNSNWIYYTYPLEGKVLTGNNFWDKPSGGDDTTPPGNWANFQPANWVNTQTPLASEQVEDTQSGLNTATAAYQYSTDGGVSWSGWLPASITGIPGTTDPQVISASVPFGYDSGPNSLNLVQFSVADMVGNLGISPEHAVKIDSVLPINPSNISSSSHEINQWSNNPYISLQWSGASDDRSGINGYSSSYDQSPTTIPDVYRDTIDPSQVIYAYYDSSSWWFHVRTLDNAGNAATGAMHYGPFYIDITPPLAWFTFQAGAVNIPTIVISWDGGDTLSGVSSFDVQTNINGGGWVDWYVAIPDKSAYFSGQNGQDVLFRVRARDIAGNISGWTDPIWVHFGVSVTVRANDENGVNLWNARIFRNGIFIGLTDPSGLITVPDTMLGDSLIAIYMITEGAAGKSGHTRYGNSNWAYHAYITNVHIPDDGTPEPFQVVDTNIIQDLALKKDQAVFGVHMIVVVGWDVDAAYLADLKQGLLDASDFLYDVTDGQFFFETIEIFDNGQNGPDNDMYIYTDDTVWPNAFIGAISRGVGRMMFPPVFLGPWSARVAYGTIVHEFGHYGLWLYDEYLKRDGSGGGFCTLNRETAPEPNRASIMNNSDDGSELCSKADPDHLHNSETDQDASNNGESTWQTVLRKYGDTSNPARWTLQSPDTRQVAVVSGPVAIPASDWTSVYITDNNTGVCAPFSARVTYEDGSIVPQAEVWVGASATDPILGQGLTNDWAFITVRGAHNGDFVYAKKGNASGSITISCTPGVQAETQLAIPIIVIRDKLDINWVKYTPLALDIIGIQVEVSASLPAAPQAQVWQEGAAAPIEVQLSYDSPSGTYIGQVQLDNLLEFKGTTQVIASDSQGNNAFSNISFALQLINAQEKTYLKSGDGQLVMILPPGSLSNDTIATIQVISGVGLQQGELRVIGNPFSVQTANGEIMLQQTAVLNVHYSLNPISAAQASGLGLYRWDDVSQSWMLVSNEINGEQHMISAYINQLGIYAILAPPLFFTHLPLIAR